MEGMPRSRPPPRTCYLYFITENIPCFRIVHEIFITMIMESFPHIQLGIPDKLIIKSLAQTTVKCLSTFVLADADLHCLHHHFQLIPGLWLSSVTSG